METASFSDYTESHQGGVPLVLYNGSQPALPMAVFSQLDWPKAQHVSTDASSIGIGVKATVEKVPKGWSQRSILSAGFGIQKGMMAWGTHGTAHKLAFRYDVNVCSAWLRTARDYLCGYGNGGRAPPPVSYTVGNVYTTYHL